MTLVKIFEMFLREWVTEDIGNKIDINQFAARPAGNEAALMMSILDPESSRLPEEIRYNWESITINDEYVI